MKALKTETNFVTILDQNRKYYGGNQGWYIEELGKEGGCGPVAAANILAYYGVHHIGRQALLEMPLKPIDKESFKRHMMMVFKYVKPIELPKILRGNISGLSIPITLGVPLMSQLIKGTVRYARDKGVPLKAHKFSIKYDLEKAVEFIEVGLLSDAPIAVLIFKNSKLKQVPYEDYMGKSIDVNFQMHWGTITAMDIDEQGAYILKVATWGGWAWLPLKSVVNHSGFGGMVYFKD